MRGADARGAVTKNSPLYLGAVAKLVAAIRGESPEDVLEVTYHNAGTFLQLLLRYWGCRVRMRGCHFHYQGTREKILKKGTLWGEVKGL